MIEFKIPFLENVILLYYTQHNKLYYHVYISVSAIINSDGGYRTFGAQVVSAFAITGSIIIGL